MKLCPSSQHLNKTFISIGRQRDKKGCFKFEAKTQFVDSHARAVSQEWRISIQPRVKIRSPFEHFRSRYYLNMTSPAEKGLQQYFAMLETAIQEAEQGLAEGGVPIGAALFDQHGKLLGRGHNRRVQENDPAIHAETDAFRKAGRHRNYRDKIMVTTLAPCWYCSGLIRQFRIGTVIVGESVNFPGGVVWLREHGVEVIDLHSEKCICMLADYIAVNPEIWNEDIGEE